MNLDYAAIPQMEKPLVFPIYEEERSSVTFSSPQTAPVKEQGPVLGYGFRNTSCLVVINTGHSRLGRAGRHDRNHTPVTGRDQLQVCLAAFNFFLRVLLL